MKILAIGIIILLLPIIPAFGYITTPMGYAWHKPPIMCIWDNTNKTSLLVDAAKAWKFALKDKYGKQGDFPLERVTSGADDITKKCNIHVILIEDKFLGKSSQDITGRTIPPKPDVSYVFVYERNRSDEAITRTTMHEIGHSFGLNHWIPQFPNEGLKPWPDTIMWAYEQPYFTASLDQHTLKMFDCIYGDDGWYGTNSICYKMYASNLSR